MAADPQSSPELKALSEQGQFCWSEQIASNAPFTSLSRAAASTLQATHCEAFLVSAFELINEQCWSITNGPETMHRQMICGIEVDVFLKLTDGRQILIFLDGARFHGGAPDINGGASKIIKDCEQRRRLSASGRIYNVREGVLPPLAVGSNIHVSSLSSKHQQLRACLNLCWNIWGADSSEICTFQDPQFVARIRRRCADYWFPRLSASVPDYRKLKNILTSQVLDDLIERSVQPDASSTILRAGRGSKSLLNWRCRRCSRIYSAQIGALLESTESRGCPYCGGSKIVAFENSVAADPLLANSFINVPGNPELGAAGVSRSSAKVVAWKCRNAPRCTRVCLDRPRNRKLSTGLCQSCGRIHRRFPNHWVPSEIMQRVRSVVHDLLPRNKRLKWRAVFDHLPVLDQEYLRKKKPLGNALSKWGFKQIQRIRIHLAKPPTDRAESCREPTIERSYES
jgi:DNA-directed RNA polymerase subunit RPC12/RpoP